MAEEPRAHPAQQRTEAADSRSQAGQPIRVLIVDDSLMTRRVLAAALNNAPDLTVVGTAASGAEALALVRDVQPDVLTLDVEMPGADGLTILRELMATTPVPVVMVSYLTHAGTDAAVRAMLDGAVDFVPKPGGPILGSVTRLRDELVQKVREAARARITSDRLRPAGQSIARPSSPAPTSPPRRLSETAPTHQPPHQQAAPSLTRRPASVTQGFERLVILGASTGGPHALQTVLAGLRPDGKTAYVVVQHMPNGMTDVLASILNEHTALAVRPSRERDHLAADTALLAPGDWHLRLGPRGAVELDRGPKVHFVRPSLDVTLLSAAEVYAERTITAILTGMGSDGADGAVAIHRAGGQVIAQDEASCVVWGMPRAVVQRGAADQTLPLLEIAGAIRKRLTEPAGALGRAAGGRR